MKRIIYYIIAFVFLVLITPLVTHAYFEFTGTKDAEIVLKASVLTAFGRLPNQEGNNWGEEASDPFLIQTPYHLKNLELLNNRGDLDGKQYFFRLLPEGGKSTLDVDGMPMKSIGTPEYPFKGVFDGNGKIIKNATVVADSGEVDIGFFGNIGEGGEAFNLILEKTTITSVGNYVPFLPMGHATAKSGNDKEKCHIGVFCGHLDGNAYNISIKDPVVEINSAAPGGSGDYMDYYSKYVTVGFCGANAKIEGVLVSSISPEVAKDGDTGYWLTDFFYDNIRQPVTYEENGQTLTTNFLAGLLASTNTAAPWVLNGGKVVPAEGIFEYHTGGNSGQYYDKIESIPTQTKVNYYDSTGAFKKTVDLGQTYDFNTHPDEFWIKRDLYNPYNGTFINSFKSGLSIERGRNNSASTVVHPYTGVDISPTQTRAASSGIYFKFTKLTTANPTAKIICAVYVPSGMTTARTMYLDNANGFSNIASRSVPAYNSASGAVNTYVYEFTVTQTAQTLNQIEYLLNFGNSNSSVNPRILYIAVGGQHDDAHVNTQKYAELPTIDFIYDTNIPVTHSSYVYTKILPYFLNGSHTAPVDELKLEFTRTPGTPNSFVIDAWGKDAAIDRLDSLGNTVFDYISRFPDDNFVLNRHSGPLPSMGMGLLGFSGVFGAFASFGFDEEPAPAEGSLLFTLYTDREGPSAKAPLEGAVFRLTDTARIGNVLTATSQGDGKVSFTGVLHGTYYLEQISTPEYHSPMAPFYITISSADGSVIKFGDGEANITGSYEVTNFIKRTSLKVTKTDGGGEPIGDVLFELFRDVNGTLTLIENRMSDAVTGEAVFTGLMGGEFYVVIERDDPENYEEIDGVDPDVLYVVRF